MRIREEKIHEAKIREDEAISLVACCGVKAKRPPIEKHTNVVNVKKWKDIGIADEASEVNRRREVNVLSMICRLIPL